MKAWGLIPDLEKGKLKNLNYHIKYPTKRTFSLFIKNVFLYQQCVINQLFLFAHTSKQHICEPNAFFLFVCFKAQFNCGFLSTVGMNKYRLTTGQRKMRNLPPSRNWSVGCDVQIRCLILKMSQTWLHSQLRQPKLTHPLAHQDGGSLLPGDKDL